MNLIFWPIGYKMKKSNIIVMLLLFSHISFGQQITNKNKEEALLEQLQSSITSLQSQEDLDFSNIAQIQQIGNNNNASINQALTGISVSGNVAELIQSGELNSAVLTQNGSGNNHNVTQTGNSNMFEASVNGDNNSSTIEQLGNENIINQNLLGNNMAFVLSQVGNNNEINQTENDQQSRQYQITQTGNAMKLIITNGGSLP